MEVDKLESIGKQWAQLDMNVEEYFSKYTLNQFKRVMTVSNERTKITAVDDGDLIEQIEVCNRLWIINGLLEEFKSSDDMEVRINNVIKLKRKNNELIEFLNHKGVLVESIGVLKSLKVDINKFNDEVLSEIKRGFKQFLKFDNDFNISFNKELDSGLTFNDFIDCCNRYSRGVSLFDLRKMFSEWINESIPKLKTGSIVKLDKTEKSIHLSFITDGEFQLHEYFKSIEKYIELFNFIIVDDENLEIFQFVKSTVSKLLLSDVKDVMFSNENIQKLLESKLSSANSSITTLTHINDLLSQWPNESNDLEFWIDDLSTFWVQSLVSNSIEDVKELVRKLNRGDYSKELINLTTEELGNSTVAVKQSKAQEVEDNDWDEEWDDGWGDEPESPRKKSVTRKDKMEISDPGVAAEDGDVDDEWDAWADDDDLEIEADPIAGKEDTTSTPPLQATVSYKYSGMTKVIMNIISTYYSNLDIFQNLMDEDEFGNLTILFKSSIKKIMVAILMMIQVSDGYPNILLFYNDYSKILEECSLQYDIDLTMNFKMASKFITNYFNGYFKSIEGLINEYNSSIWFDNATNIKKFYLEFNIRMSNQIGEILNEFSEIKGVNTELVGRNEITLIFKTFNLICDKLLSRNDISSDECETFTQIINELLMVFNSYGVKLNQIQSFNKLQQMKSILGSNLREINDKFYDGEFYELETFELIELIKALFIDSANRDDLLRQIQSVRDVELE